jgi:hypothetical protein
MSINNIELSAQAIADLYTTSLVTAESVSKNTIVKEEVANVAAPVASIWKYLGNNQQNVLIIVNTAAAVHLPDGELSFLTGILTACKLSVADVAILNLHNYPTAVCKELTTHFTSKNVILFGIEPAAFGLPMSFPKYQVQAFTGISYLYAPTLSELENNKAEKMKLWTCLKKMFDI